ncbi:hypothetical protein GCM10011391_32280 [Pullulanibacillus camelliae]|uniref:DUF1659 domain-containing protein n=1 Tax=Pullulanibacillus camelliae TaxID=1707096 RepID=A0A8J2YKZ9_9BACL|nr:DUF1659 domain-containing protein [Pullulanibacillus camelliae]GGE51037.1 hypothetical protein GCM10011391_32280 [Pullulanibacillus camelliae]
MATSQLQQSSMALMLDGGMNEKGDAVKLRKSFNNVKSEATADQLYAIATSLAALQQHDLLSIERADTSEIQQS